MREVVSAAARALWDLGEGGDGDSSGAEKAPAEVGVAFLAVESDLSAW